MKNYLQRGDTITAAAPYAVASGAGALIGTLFGVASAAYANGATGEFAVVGCYELASPTAIAAAVGALAYWDNTLKAVTTDATATTLIGCFAKAKLDGELLAEVRLNGAASALTDV